MIDAKNGYIKDGAKNRLREQDIRLIVDTWNAQKDVPHYARFVPLEEIEKNAFLRQKMFSYLSLRIPTEQYSMRQNTSSMPFAVHRTDNM